jgi:glycosyltransferase involved in cell wall biosynthesis
MVYFDNGYAFQDVAVLAAARRLDVPVVAGFHSVIRSGKPLHDAAWQLVGRRTVRHFDATHALNGADAAYLATLGARTVMTIPLAVDAAAFAPRSLPERFTVTFLGRLHPQKGIDKLRALITLLHDRLPGDVEFTIAGDGPLRKHLSELARLSRVRLVGAVTRDRAAEILGESAVVLMPSRYETFGYVAAEAACAGAFVVASDVSGLRDVVGGQGALIPLHAPLEVWVDAVAGCYRRWRTEPAWFARRRAERHCAAAARFSFDVVAAMFDELLARAARG